MGRRSDNTNRGTTMLLLGVYLFIVMFLVDMAVTTLGVPGPRFLIILAQFYVVKVLGDIVYYRLRPGYRDFGSMWEYLGDDVLGMTRFAFPLAIAQRLAEETTGAFGFDWGLWMPHLIGGPYLAIVIYLVNRTLREQDADRRFHAGERLHRLP